jgi:hypothetical protein
MSSMKKAKSPKDENTGLKNKNPDLIRTRTESPRYDANIHQNDEDLNERIEE